MRSALKRLPVIITALLVAGNGTAQQTNSNKNTKNKEMTMNTTAINKEVVQKIYDECLNKRNLSLLNELIADEYQGVLGGKGAEGFKQTVLGIVNAFPDMQWHVQTIVAEGNQVAVCWKVSGTHTGAFRTLAPTGKTVSNEGMGIYELRNGKVISTNVLTNQVAFLQQLGVLPDIDQLIAKKANNGTVSFIDKFFVPAAAKAAFMERVRINRSLIKQLPGFIEDAAYEHADEEGNLVLVTVAQWQSQEALNKAKETVQAAYKKEGFNMPEMLQRLHITIDRGVYSPLQH